MFSQERGPQRRPNRQAVFDVLLVVAMGIQVEMSLQNRSITRLAIQNNTSGVDNKTFAAELVDFTE